LAEHKAGESMQELLHRADAEMYQEKAGRRGKS
jgi:PleD family two-component response regulator